MKNKHILKDDYPYAGIIKWDIEDMKNNINKAKKNNSLPDFGLERVELHPTSVCQYKCPFCYGVNFKCKRKTELPLEIIENNIFKSIKNNKKLSSSNPIIILAGLYSEPLAYSKKTELIKLLGKYNFRFGIYTNGGFMNDDIARIICGSAKQSKEKGLSYISFNVMASIVHGHYDFLEKKIQNFVNMRDVMKAPIQVNIPILIDGSLPGNELKRLQKKMLQIGVDNIRYSAPQIPVSNSKIDVKNIELIKNLQNKNRKNIFIRSISGKQFDRCYVLANTLSIDHKGLVYPCSQTCSSHFSGLGYGSIKNRELVKIWGGEEHKKLFCNFSKITTYCRCNLSDSQFNAACSFLD
jgi:MoaA/NifB/PqqE/SkfB family radical SAM enzyme